MSRTADAARTALIIGASRGLGLGLARELLGRGWTVIGTVRGAAATPLHALAGEHPDRLTVEHADINEPDEIAALRGRIAGTGLDLLFVNAGVSNGAAETLSGTSTEEFTRLLVTNALSPMRAIEALQREVRTDGVVGVMNSGLGSVADNVRGGWEIYRASKAALNQLMRSFAASHADAPWALVSVAPGWVRTDMGGADATLDVETSMRGVADVLEGRLGQRGLAYLNYKGDTLAW